VSVYLAIDTATDIGSVAVGRPGAIASEVLLGTRRHAAALAPAVKESLRLAGTSLDDVTGLIVADGPGSFTGLRIGFATAQGLARGRGELTILSAPSLLSAAWLASGFVKGPVAALFDALRGQVYAAVYAFHSHAIDVMVRPGLTTVRSLRESGVRAELAVGDGAMVHAEDVLGWTGHQPVGPPAGGPRAAGLIELSRVPGALETVNDLSLWEPDYGRPAEAQARWERTHGQSLPDSVSDKG
jgi:tRNA threonylcarbamoyladenosine biosynthesis protein TsaB